MTSACDKHAIDIISLRRPTALDKLAETIPKPKGAIPNFGLPKWKEMPLESKIPMVPGPEGAYNFTRRKIGKRLWIPAVDAEFNLSDPYCYEIEFTYDSLHDKHLIPYFSRPNIIRSLIKAGLVAKNLDAKCSLRDYNMYRKYLRRLHCDSIKKELYRRGKWSAEERAIQYAQEQAEKEVRKLKEREKLMEKRRAIIRNREVAEKRKRQQQIEKQRKIEDRLQALMQRKREEQYMQRIQIKARAEEIQQKQKAAAEIERKKIIQTLLEWRRKEHIRKRKREMRLAQEQEEKFKIVEQKWQERQEFQRKQIEKEQFLLQCIEDQRTKYKEAYKEKVDKETQRMQKLLKDVKMFIRCYMARRAAGSKERICCKKYLRDDDVDEIVSSRKGDKRRPVSRPVSRRVSRPISRPISDLYTSPTLMKQDKEKKAKDKIRIQKDTSTKVSKVKKKKVSKTSSKVKKKKASSAQKGGKRRKRRKRRRKKKKQRDESQEKSEVEVIEESESATKASEASDADSTVKEKCRCQIIQDIQKAATK